MRYWDHSLGSRTSRCNRYKIFFSIPAGSRQIFTRERGIIDPDIFIERRGGGRMKKEARSDLSQKLKKNRKELDLLDQKLLTLLNRRLRITLKIGKIKKGIGKKIYDAQREKEILDRLKRKNRGPLKKGDLEKLFTTIMKVCRKSQI
jgi:chorismate mutase